MAIPQAVLAEGWVPFTVIVVLTFFFSWFYVRYYQDHSQSEVSSTLTAIVALFVALLTSALVPVDIFLVSYMKNPDGTWKDWSSNEVDCNDLEDSAVATAYYVLYALLVFLVFLVIPFMYFYYEEKDEDVTVRQRMCSAMMYTAGFLIVAVVLLLVGAFAPLKKPPQNTTAWESKLEFLKDQLEASHGETALSLLIGFLSFLGMLIMITYTAYGMTAMPFSMIKGFKSAKTEHEGVSERREQNQEQARMIRAKYMDGGRQMSSHDRRRLSQLEGEEHVLARRERHLESAQLGWIRKCLKCCRPFEVVFGVFFLLLALLIFVSLFMTCVDKALHSLGYKFGYALPKPQLPNPINIIMVQAQKVFPLDYVLFVALVLYFVYSSMAGIRKISIRCCCIKLYKIRPRRTLPQALLLLCVLLMLIVLSLNVMLFSLAPQYVMYGNQHYAQKTVHFSGNGTAPHNSTFPGGNGTIPANSTTFGYETKVCSTSVGSDQCTMSRIAVFLNRFFYKVWFFGACYYWGTWLFLGVFVIGLGVSLVKKRRSVVDEELDSSDDESDKELLTA